MHLPRRTLTLAAALVLAHAATSAPLAGQAGEPTAPADTARATPRGEVTLPRFLLPPSPERARRMLIGAGAGSLAGAAAGALYGHARYGRCGDECMFTRETETILYGLMGMSAGNLAGAIAGALWPGRPASTPAVEVSAAGQDGVRLSLTFAR